MNEENMRMYDFYILWIKMVFLYTKYCFLITLSWGLRGHPLYVDQARNAPVSGQNTGRILCRQDCECRTFAYLAIPDRNAFGRLSASENEAGDPANQGN